VPPLVGVKLVIAKGGWFGCAFPGKVEFHLDQRYLLHHRWLG